MIKPSSLFSTLLFILSKHQCYSNATGADPLANFKEKLYHDLSMETYFNLPFHERGYTAASRRQSSLLIRAYDASTFTAYNNLNEQDFSSLISQTYRRPALKPGPFEVVDDDFYNIRQSQKRLETLNPHAHTIFHLCYCISYMWRRGRKGIHRYYNLRDTYYDHLTFEIGYITQTIMSKYQNVLELYDYATKMEVGNRVGTPHLYFLYKNILEDCHSIIHLCNMLHEVTRKYRQLQYSAVWATWIPVEYNPAMKFQDPAGNLYKDRYQFPDDVRPEREVERGIEGFEHEKYLHENPKLLAGYKAMQLLVKQEQERKEQVIKKQRNYFNDFGSFAHTTTKSRGSKRWRPKDSVVYGWEPEDKQFDI